MYLYILTDPIYERAGRFRVGLTSLTRLQLIDQCSLPEAVIRFYKFLPLDCSLAFLQERRILDRKGNLTEWINYPEGLEKLIQVLNNPTSTHSEHPQEHSIGELVSLYRELTHQQPTLSHASRSYLLTTLRELADLRDNPHVPLDQYQLPKELKR